MQELKGISYLVWVPLKLLRLFTHRVEDTQNFISA